jgi:mono/diheme cytochrome c family protein
MKPSRIAVLFVLVLAVAGVFAYGCASGPNDSNSGNASPTTGSNPPPTASAPTGGTTPAPAGGAAASTEVSFAVGEAVFKERCELCHGASGMGDGVGGQALNPKPRNFHDKAYMSTLTDDQIFNTIMNGKAGTAMPPWKGVVSESQAKSLILKVRSFSK